MVIFVSSFFEYFCLRPKDNSTVNRYLAVVKQKFLLYILNNGLKRQIVRKIQVVKMSDLDVGTFKLLYENPLASENDISEFLMEGEGKVYFENGKMRLENGLPAKEGQKANYVFWLNRDFPEDVLISWKFKPIKEPGLAIMFFSAKGRNGEDIFDESLAKRTGEYPQYHHGDINAFHVSYFRRKEADERAFHTCNLRKSYGFYLVSQGADPIPDADDCTDSYDIKVLKKGDTVSFYINELKVFEYVDDGVTFGERLKGGKIGFRQLAPMIGEYSDLKVYGVL